MSNSRLKYKKGVARDPKTGSYHIRLRVAGEEIRRSFPTRRAAEAAVAALKQRKVAE